MLKTIIGLEIHAQLQTATKAFCRCPADSTSAPNTNVCPICTGQPGTLPRINRKIVELALKTSLAFGCGVNQLTSFDRKNYFSPDMPKNYQITQFFHPIGQNGTVEILTETRKKKLTIKEIHMEEDSARTISKTDANTGIRKKYLDFNRSGIGLLEIVTAPEITSPKEAVESFEAIRSILIYLDVCDGHMEAGSIRCDANISMEDTNSGINSRRVEIKNLNSFKNIQRALQYEEQKLREGFEMSSATEALTKDWDEHAKKTVISRDKETLCDYRYFQEPDLACIEITDEEIKTIEKELPELPVKRLERFIHHYKLRFDVAKTLINDRDLATFFESAMNISETREMKHLILRDVKGYLNQTGKNIAQTHLTPEKLYELLESIKTGRISATMTPKILSLLCETTKTVKMIIEEENLIKIDDRQSLEAILEEIIKENQEQYEACKYGKKELIKWFIGQMIKRTKGRSDPKLIITIIKERMGD